MDAERWRRIEALFHEALEREEPERSRYLDEQCRADPELRREVDHWLAADRGAPVQVAAVIGEAVRTFKTTFAPGTRIGPYEIVGLRGEGGMGSVYRARRDDDVFQKDVAIKVVKRGMDSAALLDRFRRERQILARLEHPNIARILDGGETGDGLPYLVMEYVEGETLLDYARDRHLDVTARLRLFAQVCEAVAYAHEHQVVHRDLKPSNILVDGQAHPRLLDFGIAKLTAADPAPRRDGSATTGEFRLLTPRYASPEHVKSEPVTARSDVYSLGLILYELLTGRAAHRLAGESPGAILKAICDDEVVQPSKAAAAVDAKGHAAPIPPEALRGDLDRIVMMAIEKDPRRRYPSARALAEDLHRYIEHLPVAARSRLAAGALRGGRRHRAAIAAVAIVVLAVGLVAVVFGPLPDRRVEDAAAGKVMLAALPLENLTGAKDREYFVDGLHEEITSRLGRLRPDRLGVIARTSTLQYKGTTKSIAVIGRELNAQYVLEGSVRAAGDRVRVTAQLIKVSDQSHVWADTLEREFGDLFSVQTEIGARVADSLELEVLPQAFAATERHAQLGTDALAAYLRGQYYFQRRWIEYPTNVQRAIEQFQTVVAAAPNHAEGHAALAQSYQALAWYGPESTARRAAIRRSKEAVARSLDLDPRLASAHATLGTIRLHEWDWPGAEQALREAIRLDPNDAAAHHYLGLLMAYTGRHGDADTETRVAEQLDPRSPSVHKISFWVYETGRRWDKAQDSVRMLSELAPTDATHVYFSALLMALRGDCAGARTEVAKRAPLPMESGVTDEEYAAAYILGRCGEREDMARVVNRLETRIENYAQTIAAAYAGARDRTNTLRWLEESYRRREPLLVTIAVDPMWDFLRNEPRFQTLLRQMALPQS